MPTFVAMGAARAAAAYARLVFRMERVRDGDREADARRSQADEISAWVGEEPLLWVRAM